MLVKHSTNLDATVEVAFTCAACGFSADASVHARGVGTSVGILGVGSDASTKAADDEARADLEHDAKVTLSLARCPRCGHASASARGFFVAGTLLGVTAIVALGVGALWMLGGAFGVLSAALFAIGAAAFARRRWHRLVETKTFIDNMRPRPAQLPRASIVRELPKPPPAPPAEGGPSVLR